MNIIELGLIAIGLSMDAFAVAVCQGLSTKHLKLSKTITIGLFFGLFQAGMPLIGWLVAKGFANYIIEFDHWIAFILLSLIGYNMIKGSFEEDDEKDQNAFSFKQLTILSIATSIDALAIGVSFAFLPVDITPAISLIGIITFILSCIGVSIGHRFGEIFKNKAELAGGIILIAMGIKILTEHLQIF